MRGTRSSAPGAGDLKVQNRGSRFVCRATVASVRPFGVFVRPDGHPQDALVHASQVNEQLSFSREDEEADKVKALEFFAPPKSQV